MNLHSGKPLNFKLANHTSVTVTISFGKGSIYDGFEYITGQVWWSDSSLPQQFIGSLPANWELAETLKQWQAIYFALAERLQMGNRGFDDDEDDFEIEEDALTNVSLVSFEEVSQSLQTQLNQWLLTQDFACLEKSLREQMSSASKAYLGSANSISLRIILQTEDNNLQRLPWQSWQLLSDYPLAEIALSQPQFQRNHAAFVSKEHKQVRILAILGSTKGIDLEQESYLLQQIPDAQVQFLTQPSRQELDIALWDRQGWDILFFAGHSQTEKKNRSSLFTRCTL